MGMPRIDFHVSEDELLSLSEEAEASGSSLANVLRRRCGFRERRPGRPKKVSGSGSSAAAGDGAAGLERPAAVAKTARIAAAPSRSLLDERLERFKP